MDNWYRIDFQCTPPRKTYICIDYNYRDRPLEWINTVEPIVYDWQCTPVDQSEAWEWIQSEFGKISAVLKINGGQCNLRFIAGIDRHALQWCVETGLIREEVKEYEDWSSTHHSLTPQTGARVPR